MRTANRGGSIGLVLSALLFARARLVVDQVRGANPALEGRFDRLYCRRP